MNKAQRDQLKKDWSALETSVNSSSEASDLLRRALSSSQREERTHRKCVVPHDGREPGVYPATIMEVSQIMILVHLHTKPRFKLTWLEAAACREDILYTRALREKLDSMKRWPFKLTGPETAKLDVKDYR